MANEVRKITLTQLGTNAGPNFSVQYSTDCISYSPSIDCTNVFLPNVGSFAYCTVDENTTCVKLTSLSEVCNNSVIENLTLTTTTLSPTTTAAPTTTASPLYGPFYSGQNEFDGGTNQATACASSATWPFYADEPFASIGFGTTIYSDSAGQNVWVGNGSYYGISETSFTTAVKAMVVQSTGFVSGVVSCTTTTTTTISPTTSTTTTPCPNCDEYEIANNSQVPGDTLTVEYVDCDTRTVESAPVGFDNVGYVCSCITPVRISGPTPVITNLGICTETTTSTTLSPTTSTTLAPTTTTTISPTTSTTLCPATIYTHGAIRFTCSDFCNTNYNIHTTNCASANYASLTIGDFIYGYSGQAGYLAYSNVSTDTNTGPFRIADIDGSGEILGIYVCSGGSCVPL